MAAVCWNEPPPFLTPAEAAKRSTPVDLFGFAARLSADDAVDLDRVESLKTFGALFCSWAVLIVGGPDVPTQIRHSTLHAIQASDGLELANPQCSCTAIDGESRFGGIKRQRCFDLIAVSMKIAALPGSAHSEFIMNGAKCFDVARDAREANNEFILRSRYHQFVRGSCGRGFASDVHRRNPHDITWNKKVGVAPGAQTQVARMVPKRFPRTNTGGSGNTPDPFPIDDGVIWHRSP